MLRNIGLFGRFASGKSTLAQQLADDFDYARVSMAANMKSIVRDVYGTLDKSASVSVTTKAGVPRELTIREILQGIGESVKDVDRDFWLRWFLNDSQFIQPPMVMDDARLVFEADALRERGWLLVKVDTSETVRLQRYRSLYGRAPKKSELNHKTETELDLVEFDMVVNGEVSPELTAERIVGITW